MRTLLALFLALQTATHAANEIKITPSVLPAGDSGFRCEFSSRDGPNEVMLYLDDANWRLARRALITVDGTPRMLKPAGVKVKEAAKQGVTVGDTQELDFSGGGVRLKVILSATSDCPPGTPCSSIEYEAQVTVQLGGSSTFDQLVGECSFAS